MSTRPGLARGGAIVPRTVSLLRARDGDACRRCSEKIDFGQNGLHPDGPTIGHIVPASLGGSDAPWNLGLEHRRCNLAAGDRVAPPRARLAVPVEIDA